MQCIKLTDLSHSQPAPKRSWCSGGGYKDKYNEAFQDFYPLKLPFGRKFQHFGFWSLRQKPDVKT